MNRNRFQKHSGLFTCRHCARQTRDVNGSNGGVRLCEDCEQGCMQENGMLDSSDPAVIAQYERDMRECFQRAVNKGGRIAGYTPQ